MILIIILKFFNEIMYVYYVYDMKENHNICFEKYNSFLKIEYEI